MTKGQLAAKALAVANHTEAMLMYWDRDLICRFANSSSMSWFGASPENMIDKMSIRQVLGGSLYQKTKKFIDNVLEGKPQVFERLIVTSDGETKSSRATYTPDIVDGRVEGFFVHVTDITPLDIPDAVTKTTIGNHIMLSNGDIMDKVTHVLKAHMLDKFPGITYLAEKHFISESKLKRDFKDRYGQTIFAYYRNLQMELAHKYLEEKMYNKNQIAFLLNFSNPSNFSQCYMRYLAEKKANKLITNFSGEVDEKYKSFIINAPMSLALLDVSFNFLAVSEQWKDERMLSGMKIGDNLLIALPHLKFSDVELLKHCLIGNTSVCDEIFQEYPDGTPGWIKWSIKPWHNAKNEIGGLLVFTEDITKLKLQSEGYRIVNEILTKSKEISRIGAWTRSIRTGKAFYSDALKEILEVPPEFVPDMNIPFNFFRDAPAQKKIENAMTKAINAGESFNLITEVISAKGNIKKVFIAGYPEFSDKQCEKITGILQEIP